MSIFNFNPYKGQSQMINGFLLLEISIMLVLVMLLSLYVCNWYGKVLKDHVILNQKINALHLACNIIERYRACNFFDINNDRFIKDFDKDLILEIKFKKDKELKKFLWLIILITLKQNSEKMVFKTGIIRD